MIAAFIGLAAAAAVDSDREARTLDSYQDDSALPEGRFGFGFATTNGITQQAVGHVKNPQAAPEDQIQEVRGSYSYVDADGNTVAVNYIADENGFNVVPASPVVAPAPVAAPVPSPVVRKVTKVVVKSPVVKTNPIVVPQNYFGGLNAYNPYIYNPYYNNINRFGYYGNPYTASAYPYAAYQGALGAYNGFQGSPLVLPAGLNRQGLRVINQQGNVVSVL